MPRTRRSFDADFKAQTILQVLSGAASQAELCRKHNINGQLLGQWKTIALEGLPSLFDKEGQSAPLDKRIAELEQLFGKQAYDLEILK